MTPKAIINHSQFTNEDYEYLKTKGYNTKEILSIWDRDKKDGTPPVTVNKYKIDWKAERAKILI
ncbi:hypothetical protein [Flavobacterium sp.]|jgi:hypothetical protein|uniref:hypothetical protein n=1 Tax=Flavobacterium sp. TaxID=239 RepID=UPI0026296C1F|nr:hypothetical protein [Flavobacterium sp.]